jgi:RNA polymerase sigma factor (sigma-70 family)
MSQQITKEFVEYRTVIGSLLRKIRPSASQQDIEDILQDTFINTYQAAKKQDIRFPKAFMVKTAIRLANRQIKVAARTEYSEKIEDFAAATLSIYDVAGISNTIEKAVLDREDFGFLCAAVNELPGQCRRVFILKKIYGFSQKEISEQLEISQSTVEKHVAKGLLMIMKYYNDRKLGEDENSNHQDTAHLIKNISDSKK